MSLSDPTLAHFDQPNDRPTTVAPRSKISWWDKWFRAPLEWSEWEYIGLSKLDDSHGRPHDFAIYKRLNLLKGQREYEARGWSGTWVLDPNVYEYDKRLLVLGRKLYDL